MDSQPSATLSRSQPDGAGSSAVSDGARPVHGSPVGRRSDPMHVNTLPAGGGCSRARSSMSAAIDKEARPAELLAAVSHLADCEDCRRFVAEIGTVTRVLRSTEPSADRRRRQLAVRNGSPVVAASTKHSAG